uniref:Uncharacterized protein n=1 Tax=Mycena chlorophos TaxID=658473 RepID=A0ABQ0LI40_MYCCL|nr:predicted protein [Mycena chlorophos]
MIPRCQYAHVTDITAWLWTPSVPTKELFSLVDWKLSRLYTQPAKDTTSAVARGRFETRRSRPTRRTEDAASISFPDFPLACLTIVRTGHWQFQSQGLRTGFSGLETSTMTMTKTTPNATYTRELHLEI